MNNESKPLPPDRPALMRKFEPFAVLITLRNLYRGYLISNENPLFAWAAIDYCSSHYQYFVEHDLLHDCPPAWVRDYLSLSSSNLLGIQKPGRDAHKQIASALSINTTGNSIFQEYRNTRRNVTIYDEFHNLTRVQPPDALNKRLAALESQAFSNLSEEHREELKTNITSQYQAITKEKAYEILAEKYNFKPNSIRNIVIKIHASLDAITNPAK